MYSDIIEQDQAKDAFLAARHPEAYDALIKARTEGSMLDIGSAVTALRKALRRLLARRRASELESKILERIEHQSGLPGLLKALAALPPSDLQSLLLHVFQCRAATSSSRELMEAYCEKYRYLGISELDQREILRFSSLFFSAVPESFQAIELSPIGPFGTNAILARISQHNTLSTIRNSEVVSDPTVMLALEAAYQRKKILSRDRKSNERVRLATIKRLLRLQPFDPSLGYMQHFNCFGACTAGRETGHEQFVSETAEEHMRIYLDFVDALSRSGFSIDRKSVV